MSNKIDLFWERVRRPIPKVIPAAIFVILLFIKPILGQDLVSMAGRAAGDSTFPAIVFFKDKGYRSQAGLQKALSEMTGRLTPRALSRRAKAGRAGLDESDLPVCEDYVQSLEKLGAKLRHRLRWLNAASFEMNAGQMNTALRFGFVDRIEPLKKRLVRLPEPEAVFAECPPLKETHGRLLSYGPSYRQNQMINAVVCHDSGYSGAGVLVAMLDNGFRKNHQAFSQIISSGRLVDEWDFVQNRDTVDWAGHGTATWSVAGGYVPGQLIGPAYGASWAIYHTEDNNREMPIEEDHWAAALERADLIGADVVSSSLGYRDFDSSHYNYSYQQLNGQTAISTIAAKHAASLGIIVCTAMGNSGPGLGSLLAPADADSILSIGATDSLGNIANYSSRGPTYDGRPKPEVCAQGSSTYLANWNGANTYSRGSGTSFATPLVAGACAIILEAHPHWTPMQVREALMMTASRASHPDSHTYGWGVIDTWAAMHYQPTGDRSQEDLFPKQRKIYVISRPNPFQDRAIIEFYLQKAGAVNLNVYDISGNLIYTKDAGILPKGKNIMLWPGCYPSGSRARNGLYFIQIETQGQTAITRALLLR